jgi:hypothetical protein
MIKIMLYRDVSRFLVMVIVILLGFGVGLKVRPALRLPKPRASSANGWPVALCGDALSIARLPWLRHAHRCQL